MELTMSDMSDTSDALIQLAARGDESALAQLFATYRSRLRRMVQIRLDRRLQGRVDPSDVLQDAYLDLTRELPNYSTDARVPFFLWLRLVTGQRLMRLHREHLGVQARSVSKEVSLFSGPMPAVSSVSLAAQLAGKFTSASKSLARAEVQVELQQALNQMDETDREVITLRNFEELTNGETASVLGLTESATSKRYVRALARLQKSLQHLPSIKDWQN